MGVIAMFSSVSIAQTSLQGKVTDGASNEPILFGTVALLKDGAIIKGVETDLDGNYYFSDINPGTYDVEASYVGYTASRLTDVLVKADKSNKLDLQITEGVLTDEVVITAYTVPLIEFDNTSTGGTVTSEDIKSLPTKNINAIAATTAGIAAQDGSDDVSVRGGRPDGTVYYIDGVRVTNAALIPQSEISQLQVITGGIEAKYGDVTGGLISLTTKGPSQQYSGGLEVETSELTDPYGYNLLSANVAGPILKRDDGTSLIGFRFSGQFLQIDDDSPSAVGVYRASEEDIAFYENDPLYFVGTSPRPSTEQFGDPDGRNAQLLDARPNSQNTNLDVTAKLDALITDNIDVTLSASYYDRSDFFSPDAAWTMFNWQNNPENKRSGYRGSFRFRHKIGQQANDPTLTEEEKAEIGKATFRNLSYAIQVGVEKDMVGREDPRFEDRLFEYGYYGTQERRWEAIESVVSDTMAWTGELVNLTDFAGNVVQSWAHQGSRMIEEDFIPGSVNSVLSQFNTVNGLPEPEFRNTFGNLYSNVGREYNSFFRSEQDVYNGQVTVSFDLTPGGSEKGRHNIQLGLALEQRINRRYNIAPRDLWLAARVNTNNHISGVDTDDIIGSFESTLFPGEATMFTQYQNAIEVNDDSKFFRSIRTLLGKELEQYVNIDEVDPNALSLDMFSARELNDERIIDYYGYDYTGNKLTEDVAFEDFFTSRGEDGLRDFKIGANKPIYGSAYIQDKFAYKDIIFKIGVRMDYFDANTKVLRDNYSLYDIETADEFYARTGGVGPDAVPGDAKVYIAGAGSEDVVAFRDGDTWLQPNGTATSPALLFESEVTPSYSAGENLVEIREEGFDVDGSFEDYTPQINWMPRLAFSFPISDDAGFFAHYDVLYQRPTSNNIQTALNYFNLGAGDLINNPNLKPVRTVDYEVGYKQKLTSASAMTLSAYYREQRDMIQRRIFSNVPSPIFQYETFDNLDFGTVKGFSFTYDRRRVGNIKLTATYTLQFADGSGSDANSSGGINSRGPIRNLIPLSYDERHRITSTIDYRFGSGKKYNGPRIGGVDIFANTGLNLIVNAVSGRPYTKRRTVQQFGGVGFEGAINGARLPWNSTIDARLDKSFNLGGGEGGRPLYFNVYLRVQNLLDARNIYGVYSVTGSAEDDGYLISSFGEDRIDQVNINGQSEEVFLAQYNYRLLQPGFFSLARRIYLGATVTF